MKPMMVGGQALIEGVMMRSPKNMAIAVRKPNGKISLKKERIKSIADKYPVLKLPLLRGVIALYENLSMGLKAMLYSATEQTGDDEELTKKELAFTLVIAFSFTAIFFIALPLFLTNLITKNSFLFNIIDGIFRFVFFLTYLIIISFFKDVRRLFQYHGAEHMAIHAYEHGKKLTTQNVKKFATMHPRCGTSFLIIVFILSIIVFSFVTHPNLFIKFGARLVLIPFIAGVSYELLKASARLKGNILVKALVYPGIALQRITTKRPDNKQIEVAIKSLNAVIRAESKKSHQ